MSIMGWNIFKSIKILDRELCDVKQEIVFKIRSQDVVLCRTCGCLVCKCHAIKGKSEIVKNREYDEYYGIIEREVIREVYYCGKCDPSLNKSEEGQ